MSTIILSVASDDRDRLVAGTRRAMRQSVGVTVAELARRSGIPRRRLKAIEAGGRITPVERLVIRVALGSLSGNRAAAGPAT